MTKGIIKIKRMNYPDFPIYATRSEFAMEKILHKYKVLARKHKIAELKLEQDIPYAPLSLPQYLTPERRINFIKIVVSYFKLFLP